MSSLKDSAYSKYIQALPYLTGLLLVAWPARHSVAIRNSLLGILLIWVILSLTRNKFQRFNQPQLAQSGKIFLVLSTWLISTVLWSDSPLNALNQYRGEWLIGCIALICGACLGIFATQHPNSKCNRTKLINIIWLALLTPGLIQICYALVFWSQHQSLPLRDVPIFGVTSLSFELGIFFSLLLADTLARLRGITPLINISNRSLGLIVLLFFLCTYLANMRNGTMVTLILAIFALGLAWPNYQRYAGRWLQLILPVFFVFSTAVFIKLGYDADPRWHAFKESSRIAWDTEHHKAWLDDRIPLPSMSNGQPVDHSAYMRLAWFKEGVLAIRDYPLGVGFGRNAFGHAMKRKYGFGTGHSHSSLIDFTLSGGLPGLILWVVFCGSLIRLGWHAYYRNNDVIGMALVMLVSGTLIRMVVDSNLRDHGLEQFLFLAAILASLAAASMSPPKDPAPLPNLSDTHEPA